VINIFPTSIGFSLFDDPFTITIEGTLGENDWYITPVNLTFIYNPEAIKEIWYSINSTGEYQKYEGPLNITEEGLICIGWYWVDFDDIKHYEPPICIPIDLFPPKVKISKISGNTKVTFIANANDNVSGIARVKFYLDDDFQAVVDKVPYKWTYYGTESHLVYAKAYDGAGHIKYSEKISTPRFICSNNYKLLRLILYLQYQIGQILRLVSV
jgi:hypothetical protein